MSTICIFFFLINPPTTKIYTLPLPAALPIGVLELDAQPGLADEDPETEIQEQRRQSRARGQPHRRYRDEQQGGDRENDQVEDRKSTRLNSSHANISYAVFCLKKKKKTII